MLIHDYKKENKQYFGLRLFPKRLSLPSQSDSGLASLVMLQTEHHTASFILTGGQGGDGATPRQHQTQTRAFHSSATSSEVGAESGFDLEEEKPPSVPSPHLGL